MKITLALLRAHNACAEQVGLFKACYPEGVEVTAAECRRMAGAFDWDWAAKHLLSEAGAREYRAIIAPSIHTFSSRCRGADDDYFAATKASRLKAEYGAADWNKLDGAYDAAMREHYKTIDAALEAQDAAFTAASKALRLAKASAFGAVAELEK